MPDTKQEHAEHTLPTFAELVELKLASAAKRDKIIQVKITINTARMMLDAERQGRAELLEALERAATFIGEALIDNELPADDSTVALHNDLMAIVAKAKGQ